MIVPARSLAGFIPADSPPISLFQSNRSPCRQVSATELILLAACGYVVGHARGKKLAWAELLVPPNVAFAALGEHNLGRNRRERRISKPKGLEGSDASRTLIRQQLENHVVHAHHATHCSAWSPLLPPIERSCI